jgi:glutaredoxin-related protein
MAFLGYAVLKVGKGYQYCRLFDELDKLPPEPLVPDLWYGDENEAANCQAALKVLRRETVSWEYAISAMAGDFADNLIELADDIRAFDPEKFNKYIPEFEEVQYQMAGISAKVGELRELMAHITPQRPEEDRL